MIKQLMADLKSAMKNKDRTRKDVLQLIIGKAKGYAKDEMREVEDKDVVRSIRSEYKQTVDAFRQMQSNLSPEQIAVYEQKIDIIKGYADNIEQMPMEKVIEAVEVVFSDLELEKSVKSMGTAVKELKERIGAQAEGAVIAKAVREYIVS